MDLVTKALRAGEGRKFKAFLVKQPDGKIGFEFQPRAPKEKAAKPADKPEKAEKLGKAPEEKPTRRGSARRAR